MKILNLETGNLCHPSWGCGRCEWCKKGYQNFCIHRHGVAKGFAEYVYPPEENVYKN